MTDDAIPEGESRWRELLTEPGGMTWTADGDGKVISVTTGAGVDPDWLLGLVVGRSWHEGLHPADLEIAREAWDIAVAGGPSQTVECRIRSTDGQWIWVSQTLTDLAGEPVEGAILGVAVDISEHRLVERERLLLAAAFNARYHDSILAQFMVDSEGVLSSTNDAFCRLVGQKREVLVGQHMTSLNHADAVVGPEVLNRVLAGMDDRAHVERLLVGAEPQGIPVSVDLTVLRDAQGSAFAATAFVRDLSLERLAATKLEQQEAFFSSLSSMAGELAIVGDPEGHLTYVSTACSRVLGYTVEQFFELGGWDLIHPEDLPAVRALYAEVVREGGSRRLHYRLMASDGQWRWIDLTATNLIDDAVGGVVCIMRDVTTRVDAEGRRADAEMRAHVITDTAEEGIWAVSPTGATIYANAQMAAMLGIDIEQVYGTTATDLLDADAAAQMMDRLSGRALRGAEKYEIDYLHPDGRKRRLWIAASPLPLTDGSPAGSLAMVSDVTEARRTERELRRGALHDPLTALPNRTLFVDRLEQAVIRDEGTVAVLFVDLDQFAVINEARGRAVGDELLMAVAERLLAVTRPQDTVARLGGDEFVVLAENLDEAGARTLAQTVLAAFSRPVVLDGVSTFVSAAIGLALAPPSLAAEVLNDADVAMRAAKAAGPGQTRIFDRALADTAKRGHSLGADLRTALTQGELEMHFQPIIDVGRGTLLGLEALARWTHPHLGAVSPARFIPIAEAAGLGSQLNRWAVHVALAGARVLRRAGALPTDSYVSVNLSASNLSEPGFEAFILAETTGAVLVPENVVFEITESALMRDPEAAIAVLQRLRVHGFGVALDDFGTGRSSLAYLRDLPVNILKIDKSFISEIRADSDALAIVASIVDLARAVGLAVVAEGVETQAQLSLLQDLGCSAAQGWLWCRATSVDGLAAGSCGAPFDVGPGIGGVPSRRVRFEVQPQHGLERILSLHRKGASLSTIAAALNVDGYLTPKGLRWHSTSVARAVADAANRGTAQAAKNPTTF